MRRCTSAASNSAWLAVLIVWLCCFAHSGVSALWREASGLRLRPGKHDPCGRSFQLLSLRGGGAAVPGVSWSQRQDSLMLKVEIPAGASLESLNLAGDGGVLEWNDDQATLSLTFHDKLDLNTMTKRDHGGHVTIDAKKVEPSWWPKLTSGPKPGNVKVDWASWIDEDEGAKRESGIWNAIHVLACPVCCLIRPHLPVRSSRGNGEIFEQAHGNGGRRLRLRLNGCWRRR